MGNNVYDPQAGAGCERLSNGHRPLGTFPYMASDMSVDAGVSSAGASVELCWSACSVKLFNIFFYRSRCVLGLRTFIGFNDQCNFMNSLCCFLDYILFVVSLTITNLNSYLSAEFETI